MYFLLNKTLKAFLETKKKNADPSRDVENSRLNVKSVISYLRFIPDCLSSSFVPASWEQGKCASFATASAEL